MKKIITRRLSAVILTTALLTLILNYFLQMNNARNDMVHSSLVKINQIERVLDQSAPGLLLEHPGRMTEEAKEELAHILSMVIPEKGTTLTIINQENNIILGSTNPELDGMTAAKAGFLLPLKLPDETGFSSSILGVPSYCLFQESDGLLIGVSQSMTSLYEQIPRSMFLVGIYLLASAVISIFAISRQIDRCVIRGINTVNQKLVQITGGNLDTRVEVDTAPEFVELSARLNAMVKSLLDNTDTMSQIFDMTNAPNGVYEYNDDMKRVLSTRKVATLLMLSPSEFDHLLTDKELFEEKIRSIRSNPLLPYKDVYRLPAETECYVKIQSFSGPTSTMGVITDVTDEILEKQKLQHDLDYDVLTGILSRRAFYAKMELLLRTPEAIREAALLMMDLDHLKEINDSYGHASGDKALQAAASLLAQCPAENKILARLSGDEFVLFLYQYSREELEIMISSLHKQMMQASIILYNQTRLPLRLSGGYVFCSDYPANFSQLLRLADKTMYQAKKGRKSEFLACTAEPARNREASKNPESGSDV
ncbi:MAG: sensor domain-containing diguanylate cyclase [Lachnospiraceae bacterium]|nr:sensor domain-containing diguanylate cyclase [Lachnospiraceae bacterium]